MADRRQARILAMQALCQLDALKEDFLDELDGFIADENPPQAIQNYAGRLVRDAHADLAAIDEHIQGVLDNWDLRRISVVDRNILRVAVCELVHHSSVPSKVALNEAVEISKEYGTADSPNFVNGVLDAVVKRRLGPTVDSPSTTSNSTT